MVGVSKVFIWPSGGSDVTKTYHDLTQKIEALGGQRINKHKIHCRLGTRKMNTDGMLAQRMYMLRMSEQENLAYALLVNELKGQVDSNATAITTPSSNGLGSGPHDECVILECGLDGAFVLYSADIYVNKMDALFEGSKFAMGDFVICTSVLKIRNCSPRGIVVEIQYSPCKSIQPSKQPSAGNPATGKDQSTSTHVNSIDAMMDEFLSILEPKETPQRPIDDLMEIYNRAKLSKEYSLRHTALQYVAAFNILR